MGTLGDQNQAMLKQDPRNRLQLALVRLPTERVTAFIRPFFNIAKETLVYPYS
jgi:hypothetical protein